MKDNSKDVDKESMQSILNAIHNMNMKKNILLNEDPLPEEYISYLQKGNEILKRYADNGYTLI